MRVTQGMYYQNFNSSNSTLSNQLLNVTQQISSGTKIQYSYQDPNTFAKTLNLNDQITTFNQVLSSVDSGQSFSTQTDSTMSDMVNSLTQFKTDLIQAASGVQSTTSMNAIAQELTGIKSNLMNLANTSIGGQYLFSGSATSQKPIDSSGNYQGNDQKMTSFLGSGVTQTYNVPGSKLFLGNDSTVSREITTNVPHLNQTLLHPQIMSGSSDAPQEQYITSDSTIRDLMGASDNTVDSTTAQQHFYIQGTKHDGSTFATTINLKDTDKVSDLITKIGEAYGNTPTNQIVNVSLNDHGEFVIKDALPGSSKLDFHMVANTDPSGPVTNLNDLNTNNTRVVGFNQSSVSSYVPTVSQQQDLFTPSKFTLNMNLQTKDGSRATAQTPLKDIFQSNISSISLGGTDTDGNAPSPATLAIGSTTTVADLMNAIQNSYKGTSGDLSVALSNGQITLTAPSTTQQQNLDVSLTSKDSSSNTISALTSSPFVGYSTASFTQNGAKLTSNVSQIVIADNSYATGSTKLSQVSGASPFVDSANGVTRELTLTGVNVSGTPFKAQIDLKEGGSTFSVDGGTTNYPIYNMATPRAATDGNDVTYQQLNDVVNMVVSGNLPATTSSATDYDDAIAKADVVSTTSLNSQGALTFEQNNANVTKAQISLYDSNANNATGDSASLEFTANKSLAVSDPKTNFFATLDKAIQAVQENKVYPDGTTGSTGDVGVQNAISMIDSLNTHVINLHSLVGSQTQALQSASDNATMLKVSTQTIQSSVIDTNVASATATLNQLQLNQQALYASLSKVSKLSLVNYL